MMVGDSRSKTTTRDAGFTLIELLVVVWVIAILIAIAIPSFLGFRQAAQDRAAQASLVVAEKTARWIALTDGEFQKTGDSVVLLNSLEPSYTWVDHKVPSTGPGVISLDEDDHGADLNLAALSDSGTCFYLRVVVGQPVAPRASDTDADECVSHDFQGDPDTGW